ncbi:hypothetical protein [Devosia sp. MC521]|uniref:hypothetical protein n=1 Tax=Devosia sp. MC521 TaxID=2759954 RepID=UPI0015FA00E6|nr:hypothetical protein [Devosia sp. MC521]MBJ6987275.1 hypothetical protein [Devosia sp. MC521]QMW62883.1 hypothetical protein H4N61_00480 [Devosia sp. MC521]
MTNVYATPERLTMKAYLFKIAVEALEADGWRVERVPGSGKSSVRRITRGQESKVVSIRTTQDTWIAFPRLDGDSGWRTLDEVDAVVPVSVDDRDSPRFAKVHLVDGDEMRDRFNRAYEARKNAGHSIPVGRGVWVSLYLQDANDPPTHVGAGAGLKHKPIATVALSPDMLASVDEQDDDVQGSAPIAEIGGGDGEAPLSIAEAKRRLAKTFGVTEASIKITVEA